MATQLFERYVSTKTPADIEEINFVTRGFYKEKPFSAKSTMSREEYDAKINEALRLVKPRKKN